MSAPHNAPDRAVGGRVQSVERALALMQAIADASPQGDTVAELALACGINRATAWRLLVTLEDHGMVDRDPATNRYQIGYTVARLAAASGTGGLVRRTHHVLEQVCVQTGEVASLAVGRRSGVVYVDEVAPLAVLTVSWLGRPVPLHATSTGKAWLAWLPKQEAREAVGPVLEGFTDATITDISRLDDELAPSARANSSRRCTGCRLRCCGQAGAVRSRCSASGDQSTGCRHRGSKRSALSSCTPRPRWRGRCATYSR